MKTRRLGEALRLWLAALALLAAGCGATSVKEGKAVTESAPPAPPAPPSTNVVVAETTNSVAETAVQRSLRPSAPLPDEISKVVQLVESGAGEEVVRAYVGASNARYELSLDQIIYLRDIGVPDTVIAAMMRRGSELREKDGEAAAMQTNLVAAAEQIKQGLAANGATAAGTPPAPPSADGTTSAPPAPGVEGVAAEPTAPPVAVQAVQVPAEAPPAVQQFYSPMSPYGTWYQVPSYGWVWQPQVVVVDSGWMPYRHGGRWVWSDCGWYWCSDYSWGWAPFHYGRWCTYPGLGWCWVPDNVWGPSWVTWRHCDSHIGWAPLPPSCGWATGVGLTWHGGGVSVGFGFGLAPSCYTFVPSGRFCYRNLAHHAVRGGDHDGAFRRSTVVNNVIHGDNNVIINNGIGYSQVASRVRDEIPKARIQPLPSESRETLKVDRLERSKDGLVVYRPTPVENAGGRPAVRSEVRPVATGSGPGSRLAGQAPARPTIGSRYPEGTPASPRSVESRGARPAAASGIATTPSGTGRPTPSTRPTGAGTGREVARPYSTITPRANEARPIEAGGQPGASTPSGGVANAPVRQTAPVPLGDPSRNIPGRLREPTRSPTAVPSRPDSSRAGTVLTAPSAPSAPTSPGAGAGGLSRPTYTAPTPGSSVPRSGYSAPSVPQPLSRPSYSAPSAPASLPRPSYSAPSPSVSIPSPSSVAPRSTYSAPAPSAAPAISSPNVSRPAPSAAPAPSANPNPGNSSRNNGRNQSN